MANIVLSHKEAKSLLTHYEKEMNQLTTRLNEVKEVMKLLGHKGGKEPKVGRPVKEAAGKPAKAGRRKYKRSKDAKPTMALRIISIIKANNKPTGVIDITNQLITELGLTNQEFTKTKNLVTQAIFKLRKEGKLKPFKQANTREKLYGVRGMSFDSAQDDKNTKKLQSSKFKVQSSGKKVSTKTPGKRGRKPKAVIEAKAPGKTGRKAKATLEAGVTKPAKEKKASKKVTAKKAAGKKVAAKKGTAKKAPAKKVRAKKSAVAKYEAAAVEKARSDKANKGNLGKARTALFGKKRGGGRNKSSAVKAAVPVAVPEVASVAEVTANSEA